MIGTVGVIGIGRMGLPICARLSAAGLDVAASDRRRECEPQARAAGARWVSDARDLAAAADVLLTVLPGSEEIEDVMASVDPALRPGMAWIDMTSADPRTGVRLVEHAERRGVECLDATLGGGVTAAGAGTLQLFVGGPEHVLARHRPLLEVLGSVEHVGGRGAGRLAKLVVNSLWFAQAVALGEALVLAAREGLDLRALVAAIGRSAAASELARSHAGELLSGQYLPSYGLDRCCDQLDAVVDLAMERGLPRELLATVQGAYRDALARYGPVDGELLAVAALEERAGIRLSDEQR